MDYKLSREITASPLCNNQRILSKSKNKNSFDNNQYIKSDQKISTVVTANLQNRFNEIDSSAVKRTTKDNVNLQNRSNEFDLIRTDANKSSSRNQSTESTNTKIYSNHKYPKSEASKMVNLNNK